jgi:hypothetical protein
VRFEYWSCRKRGRERQMVSREGMESITERLSWLENLYFPQALQSDVKLPSHRKPILLDLLSRDVALFLGISFFFLSLSLALKLSV